MPHKNIAVAIAHGDTTMTGQAQAVMLHTNVGLANGTNSTCDQLPMFFMSGRMPVMERGSVNWDDELRFTATLRTR